VGASGGGSSVSQEAVDHYTREFENKPPAGEMFSSQRQSALDSFRKSGFPTKRNEHWKYTDVRPIIKRNFQISDNESKSINSKIIEDIKFLDLDCDVVVFSNGCYSAELSHINASTDGTTVRSLNEVLSENDPELEKLLMPEITGKNAFVSLNTAFLADGVFISVPDKAEYNRPIHLIFISDQSAQVTVSHFRNYIILGRQARATVIESYVGINDAEYFTNTMTEVRAGEGSVLEHYKLQEESLNGYHVGNLNAILQKDSHVDSHSFSIGGALVRNDIDVDLNDSGAHIGLNGLYVGNKKQHIDNHTCINHSKPNTTSEEVYRGVMNGHSRGVFNGKVVVHQDAQKTDAQQNNANLLLSDTAEVDTKPELEIYADDVKCSHGATIGQLDENMLFYLRSRAIDEETARSLLTFAFADEVISRITIPSVRKHLESLIVGKLPDADVIQEFLS
jgi:Fe-S cluster assembly protein SufD